MFNRGRHYPDLYTEVEKLRGEREGDLAALRGRRWDAVIDTCGYLPRVVQASSELLADAVDQYTFISSLSVYADFVPGMDETAVRYQVPERGTEFHMKLGVPPGEPGDARR